MPRTRGRIRCRAVAWDRFRSRPICPWSPGAAYDGLSKPGCATRTWAPGQALIDPNTYAAPLNVRCFGRFPWLSFGLPGPSTPDDQLGEVPWIFMSANLVVGAACLANLNPLMLSSAYTGGCATTVPFPWLRVVDARGNLLSSEVAIVLILPGPPVRNGQTRSAPIDHAPAAYLEGLTVAAGCPDSLRSRDLQQCRLYGRQRFELDLHRCARKHELESAAFLLRDAVSIQRSFDLYHRQRVFRGDGATRAARRPQLP